MKFNIDEVSKVVAVTPSVTLPDIFIKIVTLNNFIRGDVVNLENRTLEFVYSQ